jgi:molecular chaperone Hsp33
MPGQHGLDEDDWNRLGYMAATLQTGDFDSADGMALIGKLFAEDDVRVFEPRPVAFRCRCSRRRTEEVLRMLGEAETRDVLAERGRVDVTCEYCGRRRSFDPINVSRLFTANAVSGPDSVQ